MSNAKGAPHIITRVVVRTLFIVPILWKGTCEIFRFTLSSKYPFDTLISYIAVMFLSLIYLPLGKAFTVAMGRDPGRLITKLVEKKQFEFLRVLFEKELLRAKDCVEALVYYGGVTSEDLKKIIPRKKAIAFLKYAIINRHYHYDLNRVPSALEYVGKEIDSIPWHEDVHRLIWARTNIYCSVRDNLPVINLFKRALSDHNLLALRALRDNAPGMGVQFSIELIEFAIDNDLYLPFKEVYDINNLPKIPPYKLSDNDNAVNQTKWAKRAHIYFATHNAIFIAITNQAMIALKLICKRELAFGYSSIYVLSQYISPYLKIDSIQTLYDLHVNRALCLHIACSLKAEHFVYQILPQNPDCASDSDSKMSILTATLQASPQQLERNEYDLPVVHQQVQRILNFLYENGFFNVNDVLELRPYMDADFCINRDIAKNLPNNPLNKFFNGTDYNYRSKLVDIAQHEVSKHLAHLPLFDPLLRIIASYTV